jgi:hypothetical protein
MSGQTPPQSDLFRAMAAVLRKVEQAPYEPPRIYLFPRQRDRIEKMLKHD